MLCSASFPSLLFLSRERSWVIRAPLLRYCGVPFSQICLAVVDCCHRRWYATSATAHGFMVTHAQRQALQMREHANDLTQKCCLLVQSTCLSRDRFTLVDSHVGRRASSKPAPSSATGFGSFQEGLYSRLGCRFSSTTRIGC